MSRADLREDSILLTNAIKTWRDLHEQLERVRRERRQHSSDKEDKPKAPEILNAPPEFVLPPEQQ